MTEDALIAVQVRLNTAAMALRSAVGETAAPLNERDAAILQRLLDALTHIEQAQEMVEARLRLAP